MERVTCFKLSYILGVSENLLRERYTVEARVALDYGKFQITDAILQMRSATGLFYSMMRSYCAGLLASVTDIVAKRRKLLAAVYHDLEISIDEDLFREIVDLPDLTSQSAAQMAFLLHNADCSSGLYFFGKELFNVAPDLMFRDDIALRDRLCLYSGRRLAPIFDMSSLGVAVRNYVSNIFISDIESLGSPVYRYDGGICNLNYKAWRADNSYCEVEYPLSPGSVVVTSDAKWVAKNVMLHEDVTFVVVLPVYPKYYRTWRRRIYHNIRFLSTRE